MTVSPSPVSPASSVLPCLESLVTDEEVISIVSRCLRYTINRQLRLSYRGSLWRLSICVQPRIIRLSTDTWVRERTLVTGQSNSHASFTFSRTPSSTLSFVMHLPPEKDVLLPTSDFNITSDSASATFTARLKTRWWVDELTGARATPPTFTHHRLYPLQTFFCHNMYWLSITATPVASSIPTRCRTS